MTGARTVTDVVLTSADAARLGQTMSPGSGSALTATVRAVPGAPSESAGDSRLLDHPPERPPNLKARPRYPPVISNRPSGTTVGAPRSRTRSQASTIRRGRAELQVCP